LGNNLTVKNKVISDLNNWKTDINNGVYRPYITVRKVNKVGRRHWIRCLRQNRDVHLLSDGERRAYTILLNMVGTVSVMEQYALDIDETMDIAIEKNVIHPRNHKNNEATVMTTDFIVTKVSPNKDQMVTIAYTFKYSDKIFEEGSFDRKPKSFRTWQKFEIEREYWNRRGVEYRVITELDATKEHFWNVEFCAPAARLVFDNDLVFSFVQTFQRCWQSDPIASLKVLIHNTAELMGQKYDLVLQLFKYTVINELLPIKHNQCIRFFRSIELNKKAMSLSNADV
jgi:hypothetical protein